MSLVNTALVGCGRVSRFHAEAYKQLPNSNFVGAVEIDPYQAKVFSEKFQVPVYSTLDELFSNQSVQLISVCTPSDLHYEMAINIIKRNVNLIIEKPVCLTAEQGINLVDLVKEYNVVASTCFQNRYNPVVRKLFELIENGELGKIICVTVCVRWYRKSEYFVNHWHSLKERSGGGALMTQAIHHVDLLRLLLGDPQDIQGYSLNTRNYSEVEDLLVANLNYGNALAIIECSTLSYPTDFEASISVIAENGTIKVGGESLNRIEYGIVNGYSLQDSMFNQDDPASVYGTSHILELKNVIDSILNNKAPEIGIEDGVKSLNLINRIYESINNK